MRPENMTEASNSEFWLSRQREEKNDHWERTAELSLRIDQSAVWADVDEENVEKRWKVVSASPVEGIRPLQSLGLNSKIEMQIDWVQKEMKTYEILILQNGTNTLGVVS